ncbi:hypothetical protein [Alloalcanivorax venustensis]|uniref:hypothetical protein n=1 Tax=Alloalcanivorax venustensis TaxID=172371 RepID=UPI001891978E|nr:hypothetical protein [Alloalcanivorax venustensis]
MEEYKRTCEDELDWANIYQLHEATLQISKSCFEFKKICVGLIGAVLAVTVKLTGGEIGHSYFSIPLFICLGFWVADLSAYYYQRKTRIAMNEKFKAIAARNDLDDYNIPKLSISWFMAAFNHSMSLYYALLVLGLGGWLSYALSFVEK